MQCWTNVEDVGPTLYNCYTTVWTQGQSLWVILPGHRESNSSVCEWRLLGRSALRDMKRRTGWWNCGSWMGKLQLPDFEILVYFWASISRLLESVSKDESQQNHKRWFNGDSTLVHSLRCWPNIKLALHRCIVFVGGLFWQRCHLSPEHGPVVCQNQQSQKAVTVYLQSRQLLPFVFALI